ncbi:hypothetical protein DFQ29_003107, partial [Apophysomyces sp. BC1021]
MINSCTVEEFDEYFESFRILAQDKSLQHQNPKKDIYNYFVTEWLNCTAKWAGYCTSDLMHFGCTSTQRAESGHRALKTNVNAIQPLHIAFNKIHEYLQQFERSYMDLLIQESTHIDILLHRNQKLEKLFCQVSKRALITIENELIYANDKEAMCRCQSWHLFGIPCRHRLPLDRQLEIHDIPGRWLLKQSEKHTDHFQTPALEPTQPWMKCILKLQHVFRQCEGQQQIEELMVGINTLIAKRENNVSHPKIMLPVASEVKAPGRPAKKRRKTALPKDFGSVSWRRTAVSKGPAGIKAMVKKIAKKMVLAKENASLEKSITNVQKRKRAEEKIIDEDMSLQQDQYKPSHLDQDYVYDSSVLSRKSKKLKIDFDVTPEIDQSAIITTFNPKSDG